MVDGTREILNEEDARKVLEVAAEAENRAYRRMREAAFTDRQRGIMELARLEETDAPGTGLLDRKCRLILENYYLPRILKEGETVRMDDAFTRSEDASGDYIEAVFTMPSGKKKSVGYNYKVDEDGKNLILFEKTFENVVLKPGDPEKYVLKDADGVTELESFSTEELQEKVAAGEIVRMEDGYFRKAVGADGEVRAGNTTMIVEEDGESNVKIVLGDNEQERFSLNQKGQLVRATTNDVTTVTVETRRIASEGPVYESADEARAAAERELGEGESNLHVDAVMQGTTIAKFSYLPVYTTSVELAGIMRKLGKGVEGYDPSKSDEENLRRQFAGPISRYLEEKGFYVVDISCENLQSDVSENVGWMNTIKTFHMTGGMVTVSYIKRFNATVTLKQGFLGRGQNNDTSVILAQLPEGSELLNPQDIDRKNSRSEVFYVVRGDVTAEGSAGTIAEADNLAVENAILAAQKIAARSMNGGISSGIREAISAPGAVSTIANVRGRLNVPVAGKDDMQLTHKDAKYSYTGTCDRTITSVENKLVSVTTWDGALLTYVEPTDPIIDKKVPTDDNYDRYVSEGDELGILLFEKSDQGLRRYMEDVRKAKQQSEYALKTYLESREALREARQAFDLILDRSMDEMPEKSVAEFEAEPEAVIEPVAEADGPEEPVPEPPAEESAVVAPEEFEPAAEEHPLTAHEALLAIFGEDNE
ncbi:MAG: hypothetical protein NC079_09260 [Clostridium sp.]|nr:hypothetical protein [Acetatifactor muris]MCM1527537.1 hypothetical protein [Bacteroides sp.]MCM1563779.1 hypothetical protein [Clostridium sp.]